MIFKYQDLCASVAVVQSLSRVWPSATPEKHARLLCPSHLPEFPQTHVRWGSDALQPTHPLLPPSPLVFNVSQYHDLFQWVCSSHQVAEVLELQLQRQSFQWKFSWFPLGLTGWISLQSKGLSTVFSSTPVWKHQFSGIQHSLWSNSHIYTCLLEKL